MELPRLKQAYQTTSFGSKRGQYVSLGRSSTDDSTPRFEQDGFKTGYRSEVHEIDLRPHPQLSEKRSWLTTFGIQFFSLAWLVPVVFLLIVNLKGHIIGASAWCPGGKCYPDSFDPRTSVPQKLLAKFDHDNHNLLGALQLASKALEVWFILITTWLVYLLTMFLAGRKAGLPIAYLTRPSEFAELPGLFDPLLWSTLPSLGNKSGWQTPRSARKRVWVYVLFTVGLCVLCNLMGPATAVLVLPSLQWIQTARSEYSLFLQLNSDSPPSLNAFAYIDTPFCTANNFTAEQYSCAYYPWGRSLDSWIDVYMASQDAWNGLSQQDMVSFTFNSTYMATQDGSLSDLISWAPNRQMALQLSYDWYMVEEIALGVPAANTTFPENFDSYAQYNNSLQVFIQRDGPILGVVSNMWLGYDNLTWWDTFISDHKGIRCYERYNISETPLTRGVAQGNFTRCVKFGSAWDYDYKYANFTIEGMYKSWLNEVGPNVAVETWTSDKAAFLPDGIMPSGFDPKCLPRNGFVPVGVSCDWDALFSINSTSELYTRSVMTNTIHISSNYPEANGSAATVDLMFDFVALHAFTQYSLDPSLLTNPLLLSTTPDLPSAGTPVAIDPTWTLAAWATDNGGLIGANRTATLTLLEILDDLHGPAYYDAPQPLLAYWPYVDYMAILPVIQTLSLVDFYTNDTKDIATLVNDTKPAISPEHPLLQRNARMNVWAYGMSSRTAWVGVVVASAGCIVVLVQFFFGIADRRRYRSPTQLLVAALEHTYNAEFDGLHDEKAVAKTPFRVEDAHRTNTGKIRFSRSF